MNHTEEEAVLRVSLVQGHEGSPVIGSGKRTDDIHLGGQFNGHFGSEGTYIQFNDIRFGNTHGGIHSQVAGHLDIEFHHILGTLVAIEFDDLGIEVFGLEGNGGRCGSLAKLLEVGAVKTHQRVVGIGQRHTILGLAGGDDNLRGVVGEVIYIIGSIARHVQHQH